MGGYIGATAVGLTTTAADVQGDITSTDTTPELILKNTSEEDTEGGREGKITFKGEQSGGEESTLAQIEAAHDGTADDQKGDLIFKTNDGSDNDAPTERMRIDSAGDVGIGTAPTYGRLHIFDDNSDIAMDANGSGQLHIDGNGYGFGVALNASGAQLYTNSASRDIIFGTNETERMRITDGNVGIGTSSPSRQLSVYNSGGDANVTIRTGQSASGNSQLMFGDAEADNSGRVQYNHSTNHMQFNTNGTERMRIDSSGLLRIGNTSGTVYNSSSATGIIAGTSLQVSNSAGTVGFFNRLSSDGQILGFYKNGTSVGSIGNVGSNLFINSAGAGGYGRLQTEGTERLIWYASALYPSNDNNYDLGISSNRYDDVFATNGTIQTSDEREKQQIASLTDAEMTAAKAISKLFKTFKWNDKVEAKGDAARTHTGVIAQQVEQAMTDAGLTASNYAFWCSDTWWETQTEVAAVEAVEAQDAVYDEEGNLVSEAVEAVEAQEAYTRTDTYNTQEEAPEGATERNRKGIRYPELLSFIGAATEQRLTSIEARLDALEG